MIQQWVIDAIEENTVSIAVDGTTMITVPLWLLPRAVYLGMILRVRHELTPANGRTAISIEVDDVATREAFAVSLAQVRKSARRATDTGRSIVF